MSDLNKANIKKNLFNQSNSKFLDSFYRTMQEILSRKALYKSSKSLEKISFSLLYLIVYFQFTSLLWKPSMNISSWSSYESYWQILSFSRLDPLIYKLGIENVTYYILSSIIYTIFILFILVFIFSVNKKQLPSILRWVVGRLLRIEESYLFIPILAFYSIELTQTLYGNKFYGENRNVSGSYLSQINSAICLCIHLFNVICTQIMGSELRHSHCKKNFQAKASCATDIKRIFSRVLIVIFYCNFSFSNIYWLYFLCGSTCLWLGMMYMFYIPYYNQLANEIVMSKICSEFVTVNCFVVGIYIDNAGFIILSNLCVVPLIVILAPVLVKWRYFKIPPKPEALENYLVFEITMRKYLCDIGNPSLLVIDYFNNFCKNKKIIPGLVGIWECNYCMYTLKDYRLAYVKLYKSSKSLSLEVSFNRYKCRKYLKEKSLYLLEDLNFLNYILKLSLTKDYDKTIIQVYISFAAEIVSSNPSIINLENYVGILYKQLKHLKKSYENLCIRYPKGKECQKLWMTFNEDIYMHGESALMSKIKYQVDEKVTTELNYFDEKNGILLISAERGTVGDILYGNEQFARIIHGSISTLINSDLNSLIPQVFVSGHNEVMTEYASFCKNCKVEFPQLFFIVNERGYLVECYMNITCASLGDSLFYLVVARKFDTSRQIVLVNEHGVIVGHSEYLKNFTGNFESNYKNYHISMVFPSLNFSKLDTTHPQSCNQNNLNFQVQQSIKTIKSTNLTILTFTSLQNMNSDLQIPESSNLYLSENPQINRKNLKEPTEKSKVKFNGNVRIQEKKLTKIRNKLEKSENNENNEKTKSDSSAKYESTISNLVKGLSIAIKNLKIMKWMMLIIVRYM